MATGCSGIRTATVPRVSPRSHWSDGWCLATRVSAPGQKASTSSQACSEKSVTRPCRVFGEPIEHGRGHVAAAALGLQQVADGLRAEGVGADAVHGVGGQHDELAAADGGRGLAQTGRAVGRVVAVVSPCHQRASSYTVRAAGRRVERCVVTASPCGRSRSAGRLFRSGWSAASAQPRSSVKIHGTWPPWVSACSMTTTPPGRSSRWAVRSMPRMVSRPSSPENSASSGSWSRASGATYSHSVSGMYGGLEMTRSTWPSSSGSAVSASPWCR